MYWVNKVVISRQCGKRDTKRTRSKAAVPRTEQNRREKGDERNGSVTNQPSQGQTDQRSHNRRNDGSTVHKGFVRRVRAILHDHREGYHSPLEFKRFQCYADSLFNARSVSRRIGAR